MRYSDVGYTIWFVLTIIWVIAILVVGVLMATGGRPGRDRKRAPHERDAPPS